jgi:hypothetical protein
MCGSCQSKSLRQDDKSLRYIEVSKEVSKQVRSFDENQNFFEQAIRHHTKLDFTFD